MMPEFILGLISGEGSFSSSISVSDTSRFGVNVRPTFSVVMSEREPLRECCTTIGIGSVTQRNNSGMWQWRIRKNKDVKDFVEWVIKNKDCGFKTTKKFQTFKKWKNLVDIRDTKKKSKEGMKELVEVAREINEDKETREYAYSIKELHDIIDKNGKTVCGAETSSGGECQFLVPNENDKCYIHGQSP